jgi:uncharacterized repeat protein (TIGR03803 family)
VLIAPDGSLYGTASGGGEHNMDVVFHLQPSASRPITVVAPWNEKVIHSFAGPDGGYPESGLVCDATGNFYGTTIDGGAYGHGDVYELSPAEGGWSLAVL